MDFKPHPGAFLPYLEAVNERAARERANVSPLTLLEILGRQSRKALPIFDLQAQSGMEPSRYAEALKGLQDAKFIVIEGQGIDQTVQLTDAGAGVVQLAKPA